MAPLFLQLVLIFSTATWTTGMFHSCVSQSCWAYLFHDKQCGFADAQNLVAYFHAADIEEDGKVSNRVQDSAFGDATVVDTFTVTNNGEADSLISNDIILNFNNAGLKFELIPAPVRTIMLLYRIREEQCDEKSGVNEYLFSTDEQEKYISISSKYIFLLWCCGCAHCIKMLPYFKNATSFVMQGAR